MSRSDNEIDFGTADCHYFVPGAPVRMETQPMPDTEPSPATCDAVEAAYQAARAALKRFEGGPYGDLQTGAARAAIVAIDTAAPILLAAGRTAGPCCRDAEDSEGNRHAANCRYAAGLAAGRKQAADAIRTHAEAISWYEGGGVWADAIEIAEGSEPNA